MVNICLSIAGQKKPADCFGKKIQNKIRKKSSFDGFFYCFVRGLSYMIYYNTLIKMCILCFFEVMKSVG